MDHSTLNVAVSVPSIGQVTTPAGDSATCMWSEWTTCAVTGPPYKCSQTQTLMTSSAPGAKSCNFQAGATQSQSCQPSQCPKWSTGNWTDCSPACKANASAPYNGLQTRVVQCVTSNDVIYSDEVCTELIGANSKPLDSQLCPCSHSPPAMTPIFGLIQSGPSQLSFTCKNNGTWSNGTCVCSGGYSGADCGLLCSGNGVLKPDAPTCQCNFDYQGDTCAFKISAACCQPGFVGKGGNCTACGPFASPSNGTCACNPGYVGSPTGKCDSCAAGYYGTTSCSSCGATGQATPPGSAACTCKTGFSGSPCTAAFTLLNSKDIMKAYEAPEVPVPEQTGTAWVTGNWTECDAFCAVGVQLRNVTCQTTPSYFLVGDANCDSSVKPAATQACQGSCVGCMGNSIFYEAVGLSGVPQQPLSTYSLDICGLATGATSCCDKTTDSGIKISYVQFMQSLDTSAIVRDQLNTNLNDLLANTSADFIAESTDTEDALEEIQITLQSLTEGSASYEMTQLFATILTARITQLETATSILSDAVADFIEQLSLVTQEGESSQLAAAVFLEAVPVPTTVSALLPTDCANALAGITTTTYCQACDVSFSSTYLNTDGSISVSTATCDAVGSACASSLLESYNSLSSGMTGIQSLQTSLGTFAAQLQPLLATAWRKLKFPWLPGFASGSGSGKVPDLTQLSCIVDTVSYSYPALNSTQFCSAYLTDLRPGGITNQLDTLMKSGLSSIQSVSTCDECIHSVIMFLTSAFTQNTTYLDVSLPGYAQSVVNKCKNTVDMPTSITSNISIGTFEDAATLTTLANVSWSNLTALLSDPPLIWESATPSSNTTGIQLQIMNMPCTSHDACADQGSLGGSSPWWFCAAATACENSNCSSNGATLLKQGSMCAQGPCLDGATQGFDGTCPDIAVCPKLEEGKAQFGVTYFSRYVPVLGSSEANVCACAFAADGTIADKCAHAKCAAYASLIETRATCVAGLQQTCTAEVVTCAGSAVFTCTNSLALKKSPPQSAEQCQLPSGRSLSSQTSFASTRSIVLALVAILLINLI